MPPFCLISRSKMQTPPSYCSHINVICISYNYHIKSYFWEQERSILGAKRRHIPRSASCGRAQRLTSVEAHRRRLTRAAGLVAERDNSSAALRNRLVTKSDKPGRVYFVGLPATPIAGSHTSSTPVSLVAVEQ